MRGENQHKGQRQNTHKLLRIQHREVTGNEMQVSLMSRPLVLRRGSDEMQPYLLIVCLFSTINF